MATTPPMPTDPGAWLPITSREQLRSMTPEQINAARRAGRLDSLLRGETPTPRSHPEAFESPAMRDDRPPRPDYAHRCGDFDPQPPKRRPWWVG